MNRIDFFWELVCQCRQLQLDDVLFVCSFDEIFFFFKKKERPRAEAAVRAPPADERPRPRAAADDRFTTSEYRLQFAWPAASVEAPAGYVAPAGAVMTPPRVDEPAAIQQHAG